MVAESLCFYAWIKCSLIWAIEPNKGIEQGAILRLPSINAYQNSIWVTKLTTERY